MFGKKQKIEIPWTVEQEALRRELYEYMLSHGGIQLPDGTILREGWDQ